MKPIWKAILWISLLLAWSRPAVSQWCVNGFGLPTSGGGNPSPHPVCSLCERDKAKPKASDETCTNSPCFSATGVFEQVGIDLEVAVPSGPPLVLGRLYRTSNVLDGIAGPGWKSSAGARLWAYTFAKGEPNLIEEGAYVTFPDGLRLRFVKQANGTFQPPSGRYDVLTQKADGSYELTIQRSSTRYRFNQTGAPVEIEDENGNKVTYETDGNGRVTKIRDASGRYIEIVWGASGRISGARDQTNRTVSYGYSAEGMLTSVTDTAGRTSTYEYTPGRFGPQLSAVKDPWGRVLTSVTYDATGRVSSYSEHGETYTYTYRVDGLDKTKKTDSSGNETILEYTQTGQITRKTESGSVTEETGYNPDGSVAWRYGAMRESSTNVHDGQGRLLRREEARGTPL